jgi:acyl carrier protein
MEKQILEQKIKGIMADILKVDSNSVNETTTSDTVETWDSLRHVSLILALEEEFNVEFDDDKIGELVSYMFIVKHISAKIN